MNPVAYEVRNGVVGFQIWYEKEMAERVAAEQQKRHDLSGSLAAFHVVPLFDAEQTQKPQMPTVDPNCTCDEHGACAYCWNGKKHDAPMQDDPVVELIKRDKQIQRLCAENAELRSMNDKHLEVYSKQCFELIDLRTRMRQVCEISEELYALTMPEAE